VENFSLYSKLATLSEDLKAEVSDFIDFLSAKRKSQREKKPTYGSGKVMFVIKPDFDKPLKNFQEYMH
jgi:hypothetical protein